MGIRRAVVNLAFFLTPVADVTWLSSEMTVGEAIDSLRRLHYTAVPLLDEEGRYVSTLTVVDLLRHITGPDDVLNAPISTVARTREIRAVGIDTDIRALLAVAADQNFVPVVDSRGVLMGIVTRRAILTFFEKLLREHGLLPPDTNVGGR